MIYYRVIYDVFTLYMLLILLTWVGPMLSLELKSGRLRWIPRLTEPLIAKMRQLLPSMGPFDFGPVAALLLVWLVREIAVAMVAPGTA